jgi:hypothetical protein
LTLTETGEVAKPTKGRAAKQSTIAIMLFINIFYFELKVRELSLKGCPRLQPHRSGHIALYPHTLEAGVWLGE